MKRIPNMTLEELRERARILLEESDQIIAQAKQIEANTRTLVDLRTERQPQRADRKSTAAG